MAFGNLHSPSNLVDFRLTYKPNRQKTLLSLAGILDGIRADGAIDEQELLYLDTWLRDNEYLGRNRLMRELQRRVSDILADGVVTTEELTDFRRTVGSLMDHYVELSGVDFYADEAEKEVLLGLMKGMLANRQLADFEIRHLKWWLDQNGPLRETWPASEIYDLLRRVLADGQITSEERDTLREHFELATGNPLGEGVTDGMATRLPIDRGADVVFSERVFCLTGEFLHGPRRKCSDAIIGRGGVISDTVTKKIHYLVVGSLSSRDWKFSSHGRKIEKAVEYRGGAAPHIRIISEEMWLERL